jgi:hypothetical protein
VREGDLTYSKKEDNNVEENKVRTDWKPKGMNRG